MFFFFKKSVFKNFAKLTGKHLGVSFAKRPATWPTLSRPCLQLYLKRDSDTAPVNLEHLLYTQNTSEKLIL